MTPDGWEARSTRDSEASGTRRGSSRTRGPGSPRALSSVRPGGRAEAGAAPSVRALLPQGLPGSQGAWWFPPYSRGEHGGPAFPRPPTRPGECARQAAAGFRAGGREEEGLGTASLSLPRPPAPRSAPSSGAGFGRAGMFALRAGRVPLRSAAGSTAGRHPGRPPAQPPGCQTEAEGAGEGTPPSAPPWVPPDTPIRLKLHPSSRGISAHRPAPALAPPHSWGAGAGGQHGTRTFAHFSRVEALTPRLGWRKELEVGVGISPLFSSTP